MNRKSLPQDTTPNDTNQKHTTITSTTTTTSPTMNGGGGSHSSTCSGCSLQGIGIHDVLLGRGGVTNNHEGNKRYRTMVAQHQAEYLAAKKNDKILIARKIVAAVHANGGRFLKQCTSTEALTAQQQNPHSASTDSSQWIEVSEKRATEKTSQALREGLDVRNQRVRPRKQIRQLMPSESSASTNLKKDANAVTASLPVLSAPPGATQPTKQQQQEKQPQFPTPPRQHHVMPLPHATTAMIPTGWIVTTAAPITAAPPLPHLRHHHRQHPTTEKRSPAVVSLTGELPDLVREEMHQHYQQRQQQQQQPQQFRSIRFASLLRAPSKSSSTQPVVVAIPGNFCIM